MLKKDIKYILGCIRRADKEYHLISSGDRILAGVSGGKDSLMLVHALSLYRQFSPNKFELVAATLDLGLKNLDYSALEKFCAERDVPYLVEKTNIGEVVFGSRKESNPCALCAKMRRGALATLAKRLDCNKIALGHQREDVLETLLLSVFRESRLHTFAPVTWLDRSDIVQIRPMVYIPTKRILPVVRELRFPIQEAACTAAGKTDREEMRKMLEEINRWQPSGTERLFQAVMHPERYGLWDRIPYRPSDPGPARSRIPLRELFPKTGPDAENGTEQ